MFSVTQRYLFAVKVPRFRVSGPNPSRPNAILSGLNRVGTICPGKSDEHVAGPLVLRGQAWQVRVASESVNISSRGRETTWTLGDQVADHHLKTARHF